MAGARVVWRDREKNHHWLLVISHWLFVIVKTPGALVRHSLREADSPPEALEQLGTGRMGAAGGELPFEIGEAEAVEEYEYAAKVVNNGSSPRR